MPDDLDCLEALVVSATPSATSLSTYRATETALRCALEAKLRAHAFTVTFPVVKLVQKCSAIEDLPAISLSCRGRGVLNDNWAIVKALIEVSSHPCFHEYAFLVWDNDDDFLDVHVSVKDDTHSVQTTVLPSQVFIKQGTAGRVPTVPKHGATGDASTRVQRTLEAMGRLNRWTMVTSDESNRRLEVRLSAFPPLELYRDPLLEQLTQDDPQEEGEIAEEGCAVELTQFFGTRDMLMVVNESVGRLLRAFPLLAGQAAELYTSDEAAPSETAGGRLFTNEVSETSCLVSVKMPMLSVAHVSNSRARRLPQKFLSRWWQSPRDDRGRTVSEIQDAKMLGAKISFGLELWTHSSTPSRRWLSFLCAPSDPDAISELFERETAEESKTALEETISNHLRELARSGPLNRDLDAGKVRKFARARRARLQFLKALAASETLMEGQDVSETSDGPMTSSFRRRLLSALMQRLDERPDKVALGVAEGAVAAMDIDFAVEPRAMQRLMHVISGGDTDTEGLHRLLGLDEHNKSSDNDLEEALSTALVSGRSNLVEGVDFAENQEGSAELNEAELQELKRAFADLGLDGIMDQIDISSDEDSEQDGDGDGDSDSSNDEEWLRQYQKQMDAELPTKLADKSPAEVLLGQTKGKEENDAVAANFRQSMRLELQSGGLGAASMLLNELKRGETRKK